MAIYYSILAVLLAVGWYACVYRASQRNLTLFLLFAGIVLTAVASLRYGIGYDYFNYKRIYEEIGSLRFSDLLVDPVYTKFLGYAFFNKLVAMTGAGYHVLLLGINLFLTASVLWAIKKYSAMPWVSVFVYITLQFFAHSMNLIRQSIAGTLCLLGYGLLRDRKLFKYLLLTAVACLFHASAIFMLPLYFVLNWKPSLGVWAAIGLPALAVYFYSTPIARLVTQYFLKGYAGYVNSRYWAGLGWQYVVFPAIYCVVALLFCKKLLQRDPRNKVLVNSAFYTFLLYFYSTHHMILERFSIFVFFFSLFLIPELLETFQVDPLPDLTREYLADNTPEQRKLTRERCYAQSSLRNLSIVVALALCMGYFLFASEQGSNGYHKMYPYVGIWEQESAQLS